MQVTTKITVDLTRPNIGSRVNAVQGDGNTRLVEITLLSGGSPWTPPEGVEAAIAYCQPGGTKGLYNKLADGTAAIAISGNVATVNLAPQMLVVSGTVQASLVFNDQQLNRLTTFPFSVCVASNPSAGVQKVEDYLRLQWLEDKLDEYLRKAADSGAFDGADGKTPEYGVDYGTPKQIADIANKAAGILAGDIQKISDDKVDKVEGKGLSSNDYDNAAKAKVDAIPEGPKYTDTVYDDTGVKQGLSQIKDDLSNKLPKSPANWEPWTAEEQAAARESINAGSSWGMDLPLLKTITLEEAVSSIDVLSGEEGITLQEFSVFLFATAAGDDGVDFSGPLCLRSNGGLKYWGYSDGYINKTANAYKIWHTKIYDNKFAVTDIIAGCSGRSSDIAYGGFQGIAAASKVQYSAVTSINSGSGIDNLNLLLIKTSTSGAAIPRGSMIFLFGR